MTRNFHTGLDIDGNVTLRGNVAGAGRGLYWYVDAGHQPAINGSDTGLYIHATSTSGQDVIVEGSQSVILKAAATTILTADGTVVTIKKPVKIDGPSTNHLTLNGPAQADIKFQIAGAQVGYIIAGASGLTLQTAGSDLLLRVGAATPLSMNTTRVQANLPITLPSDPTADDHAARKLYVDTQVATRLTQAAADTRYVDVTGDTMTGPLIVYAPGGGRLWMQGNTIFVLDEAGVNPYASIDIGAGQNVFLGGNGSSYGTVARGTLDAYGGVLTAHFGSIAYGDGAVSQIRTKTPGASCYIPFYRDAAGPGGALGSRTGYVGCTAANADTRLVSDTANVNLIAASTGAIILAGGGAETARASDTQFLVGKTAAGVNTTGVEAKMTGQFNATVATDIANFICNATSTGAVTGHEFVSFRTDNGVRGSVTRTSGGVAFNTTSDYRLKNDLGPVENAVERCLRLQPKRMEWKADPDNEFDGFLAHEVAEVVPEAVTGEKDAETPEPDPNDPDAIPAGEIIPQQLDHTRLIPLLVASVQELAEETAKLRAELAVLKGAQ